MAERLRRSRQPLEGPRPGLPAPAHREGGEHSRSAPGAAGHRDDHWVLQLKRRLGGEYPAPAPGAGGNGEGHWVLQVQRRLGNKAVGRLLQRDQGQPGTESGAGPASAQSALVLEGAVRDRVKDWRAAADRGLQSFVDNQMVAKMNEAHLDAHSFLGGLAGNTIWALACFTPGSIAFLISMAGIEVATITQLDSLDKKPGSADPIMVAHKVLEVGVSAVQNGAYEITRKKISEKLEWAKANKQPLTVDALVGMVLWDLFQGEYLSDHGTETEVNGAAVEAQYEYQATVLLQKYLDQVQPIGEEHWGHKKIVAIKVNGGENDGKFALAYRYVDGNDETFTWYRWIDKDMAGMASSRASDVDDALTVVDHREVKDMPAAEEIPGHDVIVYRPNK
jgi:hypothetical protein